MNQLGTELLEERIKQLESRIRRYKWITVGAVALLGMAYIRDQATPARSPNPAITPEQKAELVMLNQQIAGYRVLINKALTELKFLTPQTAMELLDSTPRNTVDGQAQAASMPGAGTQEALAYPEELLQKRALANALAPKAALATQAIFLDPWAQGQMNDLMLAQHHQVFGYDPAGATDFLQPSRQTTPPPDVVGQYMRDMNAINQQAYGR